MGQTGVLVVGAGFAGAVYARELAEAGYHVKVVDRRGHIAGNCFDEVDANGVRVHRYGPHLFHTNNGDVVKWLSRFTSWISYEHKVVAKLPSGRLAPLPVNLDTINQVFGMSLEHASEAEAFLAKVAIKKDSIRTAEDFLFSAIGAELTNLFYRPYTYKMWGLDLSEMSPDVVRRLKLRLDRDPRYFGDESFQALPKYGYTEAFRRILDHANIEVELGRQFRKSDMSEFLHTFNSMPIDEYFDFRLGELPYRSIRFHTSSERIEVASPHSVVNYTDHSPFTRETWWHNLPGHVARKSESVTLTIEEPCDYKKNNMERYYPIKAHDGRHDELYRQYKELSASETNLTFIGRCGTYQYLDMHQVINQSLSGARKWLASRQH